MTTIITVLVTGVGSPGAPGVIQSLRAVRDHDLRVIGVDCNVQAAGAALVHTFYPIPKANSPAFIESLLAVCQREQVQVILPMVTAELLPLAEHQQEFLQLGTRISISSVDALRTTIDKQQLLRALQKSGLTVPDHQHVHTARQLLAAIHQLGYPQHPVCFKPTIADGSRGFHMLDASMDRTISLFYEKPNSSLLSYTELTHVLRRNPAIPDLLVMEYLPGHEYSVDLLVENGRVRIAIPRLRDVTVGGVTTQGRTVNEADVIEYARTVAEFLHLNGNVGVQVRRDRHGKVKILEVNPRIQGSIVHCTGAGVNLPYLAVKTLLGLEVAASEWEPQWGIRMQRYWQEVFYKQDGSAYSL